MNNYIVRSYRVVIVVTKIATRRTSKAQSIYSIDGASLFQEVGNNDLGRVKEIRNPLREVKGTRQPLMGLCHCMTSHAQISTKHNYIMLTYSNILCF